MSGCREPSDEIKNYEPRLNQEWVQILINLRMKYSKLFTRKRNSAAEAWKNILHEMMELGAPPHITLDKIKKKWMNLIARYKHLKFASHADTITWPYFEQIDRAYSRNPSIVELRKNNCKKGSDSDESFVSDYAEYMMKKQKFTSILIQLRYAYRHLFTGKKYAAQKGWMVIQNLLPNGQSYTIEQISKCWQNLIQRYKSLVENEKDISKISWVHFQNMHEIMTKKDDAVLNTTDVVIKKEVISPEPSQHKMDNGNETEDTKPLNLLLEPNSTMEEGPEVKYNPAQNKRRKRQAPTSLNDLLNYFMERETKVDHQHRELITTLTNILKVIDK